MIYLYYLWILIIGSLVKVISILWYWVVYPYRARAKVVVYNYLLQKNSVLIKVLTSTKHTGEHISYCKFLFYKWVIWIWLNDRAGDDTVSFPILRKYATTHTKSKNPVHKFLVKRVFVSNYKKKEEVVHFYSQLVYLTLEHSINFDYLYWTRLDTDKVFLFKIYKWSFGWSVNANYYKIDNERRKTYGIAFFKKITDITN